MKKYDVILTGHYQKRISVYGNSPQEVKEKMEMILTDTDLIHFDNEDFMQGEAAIVIPETEVSEEDFEESEFPDDEFEDDSFSECNGCCVRCDRPMGEAGK